MASELRRRDVLRASGALAFAGTAGCLDNVIEEVPGEGNGSGTDPDGNGSAPADDNDTETPGRTGDPGNEGATNGTGGNGPGESNGSDGSDATETPEEEDDSNETDTPVEDDEEEPDETEDGENGEGSEGDGEGEGGDDGTSEEGTETEDGNGDSTEDDETGGGEDKETPPDDPPEGFVTYANEELGYAIAHPEGWEVEESGKEVYVGDPGSRRELGVLTLDAAEFGSSDALATAFLENLEADYENVEVREEGDQTLASGQDARLLDIAYGDSEGDRGRRRSRILFAIDPDTDAGYVAEVAAPVEAFDDAFAERAGTMLESFRIGEGG